MDTTTAQPDLSLIFSPPVLLTFILCAVLAGIVIWLVGAWQRKQRTSALAEQRSQQEATIQRLLDSLAQDKEKLIAEYEARLQERDERILTQERELNRLRDRLSSSGVLGLFGGRQRDIVSALLLENEQLHELLAQKQDQLRDLMADMTTKLVERLDEQARESAQAVRYKQALLSAFLQQEDARRALDRFVAQGQTPSNNDSPSLPPKP